MISVNGTQVGTVTSNMITADPLSGLVINSGDAITFEASSTAGAGLEITDFRIESFTVDV